MLGSFFRYMVQWRKALTENQRHDIERGKEMEGEKVETELEFQMTKGELAEYCVNVTVKGIWSQKAGRGSIWNAPFGRRWRRNAYGRHGKGAGISGGAVFCWCLFAGGILAVSCILLYWQCSRLGFLKPRAYKVEKGYLCCKNDKSRIPCSWYTYRAETPRVLILGRPAARKTMCFWLFLNVCFRTEKPWTGFWTNLQIPRQ